MPAGVPQLSDILLERSASGVATITLNRPQRKNAFGPGMWDELRRILHEVSVTASDRVLVITGAGNSFCWAGWRLPANRCTRCTRWSR